MRFNKTVSLEASLIFQVDRSSKKRIKNYPILSMTRSEKNLSKTIQALELFKE